VNAIVEKRMLRYRRMIDILMTGEGYADLVLQGGNIINVVTREIYPGDVAIKEEYILMIGDCSRFVGSKTRLLNVAGKYISPGFIDSHMHFESSMLTISEFSRLSISSGTTTLIADPHEIGNVAGVIGIKTMLQEAETLPNRVLFTVPCLTPDIPGMETAGAEITSRNVGDLLESDLVQGIGEMQGFSNVRPVYEHTPGIIDDLLASVCMAENLHKTVEGNAPALFGSDLASHILVCGGNTSCHETTTKEECIEKLRQGVTVFMREGSTQKNMAECIRTVTEEGLDSRNLVLATDDMIAADLLQSGHMNEIIQRTIKQGIDPVEAIQMSTINAAKHFNLDHVGILAPGKVADIAVISNLETVEVDTVIIGGTIAAQQGKLLLDIPSYHYPDSVKHSVKRPRVTSKELKIALQQKKATVQGMVIIPDQNLTEKFTCILPVKDGCILPDISQDILPIVVAERHGRNGDIGKTFVKGLGLKQGAIALSVAHDAHNIVACGADYGDMALAVNRVIAMQGGLVLIKDGKVIGDLSLPIAGLMTDELSGKEVGERLAILDTLAREQLGCTLHAPFMHLSFLSLVTSPVLKLTDKGLVDVKRQQIIPTVVQL